MIGFSNAAILAVSLVAMASCAGAYCIEHGNIVVGFDRGLQSSLKHIYVELSSGALMPDNLTQVLSPIYPMPDLLTHDVSFCSAFETV